MVKKLLSALQGKNIGSPPIWLMRQAGRYLPEYRAMRAEAGSFLNLCFHSKLAAEVTLQPVRRFNLDAAIIFADILLLPHALGQDLTFVEGEGPKLAPLQNVDDIAEKSIGGLLDPIYESLRLVKKDLASDKALIGFCGAPWTVACYMIEGGGSKDFARARAFAKDKRAEFSHLLDILADASGDYLCRQIAAGADSVQIFDSWAGLVAAEDFADFVIAPTQRIAARVRQDYPHVPMIGFPRGADGHYDAYAARAGVHAVSIDQTVSLDHAAKLQQSIAVQGNLAPEILVQGGDAMREAVAAILARLGGGNFVFNLGHGITPDTPPEHVAELVRLVRGGTA